MVNVIRDESIEGQTGYRGTFSEYVFQTNGLVQLCSYNSSAQMDQATEILLGSDGF